MKGTYQERQHQLFTQLEKQVETGTHTITVIEPVADFTQDSRLCLTGIVHVPEALRQRIARDITVPLQQADTNQYYLPPESLHLTSQNVRIASNPPTFTEKDIEQARDVFARIIPQHNSFSFDLKGLLKLPASLAIRGYCGIELFDLAQHLRAGLQEAGIPDDKQYASDDVLFGTVTICRYPITPNASFWQAVQSLQDIALGELRVEEIDLVVTNSVAHPRYTRTIETFSLMR